MPTSKAHRGDYVTDINEAYGTHFEYIDEYKNEHNFKTILSTITLMMLEMQLKELKKLEMIMKKISQLHCIRRRLNFSNFFFL